MRKFRMKIVVASASMSRQVCNRGCVNFRTIGVEGEAIDHESKSWRKMHEGEDDFACSHLRLCKTSGELLWLDLTPWTVRRLYL